MEEKKQKIYVGSGVEKFDGDLVQTSVCLTDITNNAKEFIFEFEGKKYIKLKVVKKREIDQYGKSHYVEVDTWKPDPSKSTPKKQQVQEEDDLPF